MLKFELILPSLEYFTSDMTVISGGWISYVNKPTDFPEGALT